MTRRKRIKFPIVPPQLWNHGNFIVSLGQLLPILGAEAEKLGVDVFPGFAAAEALFDENGGVKGVRIGDMGVEKNGEPGPNFALGPEIHAKITMFCEGCRGSTSKQLIARYKLDAGKSPQTYGLGFKELWQLPPGRVQPGLIQHTFGWPLDNNTYGGSFIYHLNNDRVYVGFVVGLDYEDPRLKPFEAFQQWKNHPDIKALLHGGEIVAGGARTIIEGGYQSMPTLEMPGALLLGDAGGTLNMPKIKGIHQAIRSGMLAAEHYAQTATSAGFDQRWRASPGGRELHKVRNFRPGFRRGLWFALPMPCSRPSPSADSPGRSGITRTTPRSSIWTNTPRRIRDWGSRDLPPRDRAAFVFFASTTHDENQPVHLHVADTALCATRCVTDFGNPCTNFCHRKRLRDDRRRQGRTEIADQRVELRPLQGLRHQGTLRRTDHLVTPEGGSGPITRASK